MKFVMEVDPEVNPDAVGEYLRSAFFDEHPRYGRGGTVHREIGCYQTFDWQKDVSPLPPLSLDTEHNHPEGEEAEELCWACDSEGEVWTRGKKDLQGKPIECRYFWDGDGTLAFQLPGGMWLVNNDCKKDHGWELLTHLQWSRL